MANGKLEIRLWDVGQGIAIWINTPNGQNHWIDAGKNDEFDPATHVRNKYGIETLDLLVISHPDTDHYNGLHNLRTSFPMIDALLRNKQFISNRYCDLFPNGDLIKCKQALRDMHCRYNNNVPYDKSPCNPANNGGLDMLLVNAPYTSDISVNNSSIVTFYKYNHFVFIAPGDIESDGWNALYEQHGTQIDNFLKDAYRKVLVAPHHGRESGYTQEMIDVIKPSLILISDQYGKEPTYSKFYNVASGLYLNGYLTRYISTKTSGRIRIIIDSDGNESIDSI